MEEAKESQKDFNNFIKVIRKEGKPQEQMKRLANLNMLFNRRNDVINFSEGYSSMILEAKKIIVKANVKMDTIFMNSENSKTSEKHGLILNLTDKLDLRRDEKSIALSNLSTCYTWKNIKSSYNNNKFKISSPTRNDNFELPGGSYSVPNIPDYFEYI